MDKRLTRVLAVAALVSASIAASAVPAKRVYIDLPQPDGTTVKVMRVGDEFTHYYLSEDGLPLLADAEGCLRYALLDASGRVALSDARATDVRRRSASARSLVSAVDATAVEKAIFSERERVSRRKSIPQNGMGLFSTSFPSKGDIRGLVILVEYSDYKFQTSDVESYFTDMLNKDGFNRYGGTGCAAEYYREQSGGQFRPVFDVLGPVTLPNKRSYYGGNDYYGDDKHPEEMVIHACDILDDQVDFSKYDMDGDGTIDNVFVFYAGQGEASYGPDESVWPHSWEIVDGTGARHYYDGVLLDRYACSNEWEQNRPDGVGTFIHEFSHVMGLPDLYHTQSSSATYTPNAWSVMDYGPYNNDGCTPPNYSTYERNALGWIDLKVLDGPESVVLQPLGDSNSGCIVQTSKNTEYFLFENRQQKGWDAYLPGHGMLIWHVDFVQSVWDGNSVNNSRSHQYVDIVEANNRTNSASPTTMAGYSWPGTTGATEFTSSTTPAFTTWTGLPVNLPITNIIESQSGVISFDVAGGNREIFAPTNLTATPRADGTVLLSWSEADFATDYLVDVYPAAGGTADSVCKDVPTGGKLTYVAEGLASETEYFFTVRTVAGSKVSEPSQEMSFTTLRLSFEFETPVSNAASSLTENGFTANWEPVEGAVSYLLTVYTTTRGEDRTDVVDFGRSGDTEMTLPAGWSFSGASNNLYSKTSSNMAGNSVPSLKMNVNGHTLDSPLYDTPVVGLEFWAKGASADAANMLEILGRSSTEDEWISLYNIQPLDNKSGGVHSPAIPGGMRQIRFIYHKSGNGNCALDDVVLRTTGETRSAVAGFDGLDVGSATSWIVDLPSRGTGFYSYEVVAVNAEGMQSKTSRAIDVELPESTGISEVAGDGVLSVCGRRVIYTGAGGALVEAYNVSGVAVARVVADASGSASFVLPAGGMYIVRAGSAVAKVVARAD